jgi:class 3 adenylate cyclase
MKLAATQARAKCESELQKSRLVLEHTFSPRIAALLQTNFDGGIVQYTERGSVLAMDLVSFTTISSNLKATEVVHLLNGIFLKFDKICLEAGIEKVRKHMDSCMLIYNRQHQLTVKNNLGLVLNLDFRFAL